jgi:hypothetical protein
MQGLVLIGLAVLCGIWAWRADDKLLRWFLIAACRGARGDGSRRRQGPGCRGSRVQVLEMGTERQAR